MYSENRLTLDQKVILGQYLLLELTKVEQHFIKSSEEFYKVYKHKPVEVNKASTQDVDAELTALKKTCKKLHTLLAKVTHPDVSQLEGVFAIVDASYKKLDIITLYFYAKALNVKISANLSKVSETLITEKLNTIQSRITGLKTTLGWRWYNGNEQERLIVEAFIEKHLKLEKH